MSAQIKSGGKVWRCYVEDLLITIVVIGLELSIPLLIAREPLELGCDRPFRISYVSRILIANQDMPVLLTAVVSVLTVIAARRVGAYKFNRSAAMALTISAIPAWAKLCQVAANVQRIDVELHKIAGHSFRGQVNEFAMLIAQAQKQHFDSVAVGCLRSAVLLFTVGVLAPRSTSSIYKKSYVRIAIVSLLAMLAIAARLTMRPDLESVDVIAIALLGMAVLLIASNASKQTALPFCGSLVLAVSFWELGACQSASAEFVQTAQLNYSDWMTATFGGSSHQARLPRWTTPASSFARMNYRGIYAIGAPGVLVLLLLIARGRRHEREAPATFTWPEVGAYVFGLVALVASATVLRWTGTLNRLETLNLRLKELSLDNPSTSVHGAANEDLPASVAGNVAKIDGTGRLHLLVTGKSGPENAQQAPLLLAAPNLHLGAMFTALDSSLHDDHKEFRWLSTADESQAESGLDVYQPIHSMLFDNFEVVQVELEPNLRAYSREQKGERELASTVAIVDGDSVLLVAAAKTREGYRLHSPQVVQRELARIRPREDSVQGDSLVLVWDPEVSVEVVLRVVRMMAGNWFRKIVVAGGRDAMEEALTGAFRDVSRSKHSTSVDALNAFKVIAQKNPNVAISDLEYIEGALMASHAEYFDGGFITATSRDLDVDVKEQGKDFILSIHQPTNAGHVAFGLRIQRGTGLVRKDWVAAGETHVHLFALSASSGSKRYFEWCSYGDSLSVPGFQDSIVVSPLAVYNGQAWKGVSNREATATIRLNFVQIGGKVQSGEVRSMSGMLRRIPDCYLQVLAPE